MKNYLERTVRILITVTVCMVVLAGCNKDEVFKLTQSEKLTSESGEWKLTALTETTQGQTTDKYIDMTACDKDDIHYFDVDGTFEVQEGATKCNSTDPDIKNSGDWSIVAGILTINSDVAELITLNNTTLKYSIEDAGTTPIVMTYTFTKQP